MRLGSHSTYWWHPLVASLGSGVCITAEHRLKRGVAVVLEVESY